MNTQICAVSFLHQKPSGLTLEILTFPLFLCPFNKNSGFYINFCETKIFLIYKEFQ